MSSITKEGVLEALKVIEDPDFHKDIVSLGFVQDIEIEGGSVQVRLVLTTPACPVRDRFKSEVERVIRETWPDVTAVNVILDSNVQASAKPPVMENLLPQVKNTIAVASGKGGVGKSTVAANLAVALAQTGAKVGLLDADIYGPSMGLMLGVEQRPQLAGDKIVPIVEHGVHVMSVAFLLDPDTPLIWRGPMVMKALMQLLGDVAWPDLDYMVVDLPPGTGDAQLTLTQKVPLSGAVIVTTPNEVALIDARKGLTMFQKVKVPVLGIVENMSYFVCPHCNEKTDIFATGGGERTAKDMGVPFLGGIPIDPAVRAAGDNGRPVVIAAPDSAVAASFRSLAERVAQESSIQAYKSTQPGDGGKDPVPAGAE
ncbi:MAG: iron-sulfur cluster carrier protein ApbC [Acidobacteriota bacterium]|jgi:ATP-binding protein involved in chromosome partitioning